MNISKNFNILIHYFVIISTLLSYILDYIRPLYLYPINYLLIFYLIYSNQLFKFQKYYFIFFVLLVNYLLISNFYYYSEFSLNSLELFGKKQIYFISIIFILIFIDKNKVLQLNQESLLVRKAFSPSNIVLVKALAFLLILYVLSNIYFSYPQNIPRNRLFNLDPNFASFLFIGISYLLTLKYDFKLFLLISFSILIITLSKSGFLFLIFIIFFEKFKNSEFKLFVALIISILFITIFTSLFIEDQFDIYAKNFDPIAFIKKYLPLSNSNLENSDFKYLIYNLEMGPLRLFNLFHVSAFYKFHAIGTSLNIIYDDFSIIFNPYKFMIYDKLIFNFPHEIFTQMIFEMSVFGTFFFIYLILIFKKIKYFNYLIFSSMLAGIFLGVQVFVFIHLYLLLLFSGNDLKKDV